MAEKKTPNPIDVHVGSRVRLRRTMQRMSQQKLGDVLGITFQQIQKYEKGTNRIGASRMQQIADALSVPVSFFFEEAPMPAGAGLAEPETTSYTIDSLGSPEGIELNRAFARITNPVLRRKVVDLVRSMADEMGGSG